jgi:hypothetical protein
MDATTILAIISCAIVFCGWLVLPHSAAAPVRKPAVSPERKPVPLSA